MDNAPDPRPVYEADQVITIYDIQQIANGYAYQWQHTPWYQFIRRHNFRVGISVCAEMMHWLGHGKPAGGVQCRGGHRG